MINQSVSSVVINTAKLCLNMSRKWTPKNANMTNFLKE